MQKTRKRKILAVAVILCMAAMVTTITGCSSSSGNSEEAENTGDVTKLKIDNTAWNYDSSNDVYYQIGVSYCTDPEDTDYESMGIYVPGSYFKGEKNDNGTYTCTLDKNGKAGDYTAETAPIVLPVNTPGYSAQKAPTEYNYSDVSSYMEEGIIYVYAGCRGRDDGAPWGVTDLKAAIRAYRYNSDQLPGDTSKIYTFGHSGGGAQSAIVGASGDSDLYSKYLEKIGAAMLDDDGNAISDATYGAMCWCPITGLDTADESYEWMMGQYETSGTRAKDTWTKALSQDLAKSYASFVNSAGFTDSEGNTLTLEKSSSGIYAKGSYYNYLLKVINKSLNNFLADTDFPYTAGASTEMAGMDGNGPSGAPSGDKPSGDKPSGEMPSGDKPSGEAPSGAPGSDSSSDLSASSGTTYDTVEDYIDALNSDEEWITYNEKTGKASVKSVEAFVKHCKSTSKDVGAFDSTESSQAENILFGDGEGNGMHFDSTMEKLLEDNADTYSKYDDFDESLAESYQSDISQKDSLGVSSQIRQNMYNPLYYLLSSYDGYNTSTVAKCWRINTGITQGDTALTTEVNLELALEANSNVDSVDFATVWDQGHTMAERTGDGEANFIKWINETAE